MNHIGDYKGYPVYQIDWNESTEYAPSRILVDPNGKMYYGGVAIGRLDPHTYSVKQFDMSLYEREVARGKRREEEKAYKQKKAAEAAKRAEEVKVVENNDEEFFNTIAAEIDELLKGVSLYE